MDIIRNALVKMHAGLKAIENLLIKIKLPGRKTQIGEKAARKIIEKIGN